MARVKVTGESDPPKNMTDENIVCAHCINIGLIGGSFLCFVRKLCENSTTDSTVMSDSSVSECFRFVELINMENL